jgi:hypothetical protein
MEKENNIMIVTILFILIIIVYTACILYELDIEKCKLEHKLYLIDSYTGKLLNKNNPQVDITHIITINKMSKL